MIDTRDLFLQIWGVRTSQEHATLPGDQDWSPKAIDYWSLVWYDCRELSSRLEKMEQALESNKASVNLIMDEPVAWEPDPEFFPGSPEDWGPESGLPSTEEPEPPKEIQLEFDFTK